MLELAPNKGPSVPSLDQREAGNIYAVRRELEGYACALCAERASDADLEELRRCLETMTSTAARGDFEELQHAKTAFYDRSATAAATPSSRASCGASGRASP